VNRYGDQFICNFGGDERWERKAEEEEGPEQWRKLKGWHTDNDW